MSASGGRMKKFILVRLSFVFLALTLPAWGEDAQVTKVDPEKFEKLTPEQKERFVEAGKDAQRAPKPRWRNTTRWKKKPPKPRSGGSCRDTAIEIHKAAGVIE